MLLITLDGHHHEAVGNTNDNFLKENNQLPRTINSAVGILICEDNESSRNDASSGLQRVLAQTDENESYYGTSMSNGNDTEEIKLRRKY